MILITGTNLDISQLPNNEMIEYQIENEKMNIKLKTVAKSPICFQIYIAENKRSEYTITDELSSKIVYFKNDKELLKLLEVGEMASEQDIFDEDPIPEPVIEVPKFEPPKPVVTLEKEEEEPIIEVDTPDISVELDSDTKNKNSESLIPILKLEEANTEIPEILLAIPNLGSDTDSLRVQIENKDRIIAQKDAMIAELKKEMNNSYKTQEIQLTEITELYEQQMKEAQEIINSLESRNSIANLDKNTLNFLKFINYAQSYKGVVKEGFTEEELKEIGTLTSKFNIFACGSGDSNYSMLKQVKKYIEKGSDVVILDFSNDNFLASSFKLNSKSNNTMSLLNDEVNPLSLLKDINGTKFIATTNYNDIALLNLDWVKMIRKINELASGKDVIMLFGNITNFNIRYTISKLATLGDLQIFVKCSPIILSTLYSDVQFIPKSRVNIVALEYIDVVKSILSTLSAQFNIQAFNTDVEWNKLGLKK